MTEYIPDFYVSAISPVSVDGFSPNCCHWCILGHRWPDYVFGSKGQSSRSHHRGGGAQHSMLPSSATFLVWICNFSEYISWSYSDGGPNDSVIVFTWCSSDKVRKLSDWILRSRNASGWTWSYCMKGHLLCRPSGLHTLLPARLILQQPCTPVQYLMYRLHWLPIRDDWIDFKSPPTYKTLSSDHSLWIKSVPPLYVY